MHSQILIQFQSKCSKECGTKITSAIVHSLNLVPHSPSPISSNSFGKTNFYMC